MSTIDLIYEAIKAADELNSAMNQLKILSQDDKLYQDLLTKGEKRAEEYGCTVAEGIEYYIDELRKGENKMENYEFHVGDDFRSVEKYTGYKGKIAYISHIEPCYIYISVPDCYQYEWQYTRDELIKAIEDRKVIVGKYDFTKPEKKNKIEPLSVYIETIMGAGQNGHQKVGEYFHCPEDFEICTKLNEVIAYINKREE